MRKPLTMEQHYAERKIQQNKSYSRAKEPCLGVAGENANSTQKPNHRSPYYYHEEHGFCHLRKGS